MVSPRLIFLSLLLVWCYALPQLQLNPNSTIVNDIRSIGHDQTNRLLVIDLRSNRSCTDPTFLVRLSEVSLYILDLHESSHETSYVFTYPPLLDLGKYFLEAIVLFCNKMDPNNYADQCLQDVTDGKNVLALPYSFDIKGNDIVAGHRPRWVLKKGLVPAMLHTRYQKKCPSKVGSEWCSTSEQDLAQYNSYEWTDTPDYVPLLKKVLLMTVKNDSSQSGLERISVCLIGASHARTMFHHGNTLEIPKVHFEHIDLRFPFQFDASAMEDCSYAVIGFGQWPLSFWMEGHPYTATAYEQEMREVMARIRRARPHTQVFTRSMNHNGLGWGQFHCPTADHRKPPIVTMINNIMKNVTLEAGYEYIDTTNIQYPMWDGAQDYSHCSRSVFIAEAQWVLHHILGYSLRHHRHPMLDPGLGPHDVTRRNKLVKFSDDNSTIYLHTGELRAFPSNITFLRLGYKYANVQVIDAKRRSEAHIGQPLACLPVSRCYVA